MFITLIFLKILKAILTVLVVQVEQVKGAAVTFVNPIEMDYIRQIEKANKRQMTALRPPTPGEVMKAKESDVKDKVKKWVENPIEGRIEKLLKN